MPSDSYCNSCVHSSRKRYGRMMRIINHRWTAIYIYIRSHSLYTSTWGKVWPEGERETEMHTSRYIIYGVRFGTPPIYNICIYMCVYVEIKRSDRADATWRPSPTLVGTFAVACNLVLVHCCACSILVNDFVYIYIY